MEVELDYLVTVKVIDPEFLLSKRTAGTKMEKRLKKRLSNDQLGIHLLEETPSLTLTLML